MGVPGFFACILKRYPHHAIVQKNRVPLQRLYLDWNGGIHPVCRSILQKYSNAPQRVSHTVFEDECLDEMMRYLQLVVQYASPTELLYIAVDGVAPRAKMNQQRARRYKSARDKRVTDEIKRRHNQPIGFAWDTNAITPGTDFMRRLCERLQNDAPLLFPSLTVIVNDAFSPMEGEHKIVRHIRNNCDASSAIYGLDADLIFLSMLSDNRNIHLMRERYEFEDTRSNRDDPYWFVNISKLRVVVVQEMEWREVAQDVDPDEFKQRVGDFCMLCFLLGNDFLPRLPCLAIHSGGIDEIVGAYKCMRANGITQLTTEQTIQMPPLAFILHHIAATETERLRLQHKRRRRFTDSSFLEGSVDAELFAYDNMWPPVEDTVRMGANGWQRRYHAHYFENVTNKGQICGAYVQTLLWTWRYYTTPHIPSWSWYYPFHHAPVLSDLSFFVSNHLSYTCRFEEGAPLDPSLQLLCVIPPDSFHLLPTPLPAIASRFPNYFPRQFDEDCLNKSKRWQTVPILPFVDVKRVKSAFVRSQAPHDPM